jgi:5-(carboxyamino)imidazole ribonucleotide synthase
MERLDHVGVLAIELFQVEGRLFGNEMAPRVHNSGHWTIEGAETSQFENHLRAVCGMELGATTTPTHGAMVNLIGSTPNAGALAARDGVFVHLYGKEPRLGRKLGHITIVAADADTRDRVLQEVALSADNGR